MELSGKIVAYLELKSSHEDFFHIFCRQPYKILGNATNLLKKVHLHEGDNWETTGIIKQWHYTIDGKEEVLKEKIHIDKENKTLSFFGVEGDPMELYKVFNVIHAFSPKLLTFTMDYQKIKPEIPRPNHYMDFMINLLRDIDSHLLTN